MSVRWGLPRVVIAAAWLFGALVLAPVAEAAPRGVPIGQYESVDGPVLGGGRTAWAVPLGGFGYRVFERVGGRNVVVRSARGNYERALTPALSASAEALAVQESVSIPESPGVGGRNYTEFITWSKLASQRSLMALAMPCRVQTVCATGVDVDGSRVFSPVGDPSDNSAAVRSLPSGAVQQRVGGVGSGLSVASGYAAWATSDQKAIVVWDLAGNRELYRLPVAGPVGDFVDVQADGKVAFIGADGRVAWASPAEPYAHPVPNSGRRFGGLVLQSDTLTWLRSYRDSQAIFTTPLGGKPRLLVSGVTGDFDTDGTRVAWGGRSCTGAVVFTERYATLMRRAVRQGPGCRLRLATQPRAAKNGSITLRPRCAGFSRGCTLDVLGVTAARSYSVGGLRLRAGQHVARIPRNASGETSVQVRLTKAARGVLVRRSLRIKVRASVAGDRGAAETRTASFVLRR